MAIEIRPADEHNQPEITPAARETIEAAGYSLEHPADEVIVAGGAIGQIYSDADGSGTALVAVSIPGDHPAVIAGLDEAAARFFIDDWAELLHAGGGTVYGGGVVVYRVTGQDMAVTIVEAAAGSSTDSNRRRARNVARVRAGDFLGARA